MSWIKPNFLWMMYRSGWGTKQGQEVTLAVHLQREAFDAILAEAVHSSYVPEGYETEATWKARVARSQVRLQWDPDHGPGGAPVERRAIQLGLRGDFLRRYGREWVVAVEDVSELTRAATLTLRPGPSRHLGALSPGSFTPRRPAGGHAPGTALATERAWASTASPSASPRSSFA
jgi:hypothetical protein